jgi:hypothetical protein
MRRMIHLTLRAVILAFLPLTAFSQVEAPLDEETLKEVFLYHHFASNRKSIDFLPGQKHKFSLLKTECCVIWQEVKARVTWSVEPTLGAHIDPVNGDFQVDKSTPPGSIFEIKANVEDGRRILSLKVYIYTPDTHPLIGTWEQKAEITCDTGETKTPKQPIRELDFHADGTFSVTWTPIETRIDYWGKYSYDRKKGRIKFTVEKDSYAPPDIDGEGSLQLKNGDLILKGVWLGTRDEEHKRDACGLIFLRPYLKK